VQIRAAHAAGADAQQHLPGPRGRRRTLDDAQRLPRGLKDRGAHRSPSRKPTEVAWPEPTVTIAGRGA
jgi:hypothetical protein